MSGGAQSAIAFVAASVLAAPPLGAQTIHRVASLAIDTKEAVALRTVFREAMKALGYVEGRNVVYLTRQADLDMSRRAALIDELISEKPDVFFGFETEALAMRARNPTIPIVLSGGMDPVGAGLARSLGRPGLNVTGVTQLNDLLPQKHIELLISMLPQVKRVGLLFDKGAPGCRLVQRNAALAAQQLGRSLVVYEVANKADIERAFLQMENDRPDALLPCPSFVLGNYRELLFAESLRMRIPWSSFIVANVPLGVLFAYSSSREEEVRKAAT